MMGGSETVSGDKDGVQTTEIHIPIGWQRRLEGGQVIYISPTGTALSSLDEVKTYLLTDGTCKCGLECPLVIQKVFNFSVGVKVEQHNQLQSKAEQDMTKLCNHRRKVVAMAALCRSMQASQLPFAALHHPEVHSGTTDHRDPKRMRVDREEEERGTYPPKLHPAPGRGHSTGPRASPQLVYPYNGSSPLGHMGGNSHHPLDALRRLQHPPPALSASSSSNASPSSPYPNSAPQRSPRTPTPQNLSQGPRSTPKTPETPTSPRVGPLSPLPSSPVTLSGRPSHGVIVSGSPLSLSPSPSPSPSINTMNCVSPHQRSRHPSASSSLSEQVGGGGDGGGGPLGCNFPQRRKSSSSSPHSPLPGGSPKPSHHFPKYKLEDILEQFKNSGNASTNNNHHIPVLAPMYPSLISNQSGGHPHVLSLALDKAGNLKTLKANAGPANTGALSFGLSAAGPSGLPLGPFLNHHHQSKPPHPASFPASSLLSAAAKAQLASQVTHGQSSNSGSSSASSASPLEVLKETQQQVTNSTLHNKQPPSPISTTRHPPPHPSLLFPPSHPLATSLHHHHPPTTERNASHRKRQRRSPTVLSMLRDTQQLTNGPRRTPPGDAISAAIINLSSSSSSFPTSSTSAIQNRNATIVENHFSLLPGPIPRLPIPHSGPARQLEALDFTTGLTAATRPPLGLDPPTQPLSALLHLLSVQNAQASAAVHSTSAQLGSVSRQSPRPPAPHSTVRPTQTPSPRRTNNATPLRSSPQPLSPPSLSSQSRSLQSPSRTLSAKTSPVQRLSPPSRMTTNSHLAPTGGGSGGRSHSSSPSSSVKNYPIHGHIPTWDTLSRAPSRESSQQVSAATEMGSSVDLSHSQGGVTMVTSTSPKPLDLSNHVLALLAASSGAPQGEGSLSDRTTGATVAPTGNTTEPVEGVCADLETPTVAKPPEANSHASSLSNFCPNGDNSPPTGPSALGDNTTPLSLAEAFPFMNQEQLLQLLSTTGGLPSILDPAVLASLPLGGLWLGGQQGQISTSPATPQLPQNPQDHHQSPEQPQELLMQQQEGPPSNQDHPQKQQISNNPLFPLLPSLVGTHGELPLNLLGLLNPLPPPVASTPTPGQEADLGLAEKPSLQALLMASLLLGQQQAAMLPLSALGQLSLEVPLQQPQLEGLPLDKSSGLLDPSALPGPGILEVLQGLLPPPSAAEGSLQALQSLLLHTPLSPTHGAFLSLSPALLTAALGSAELHPPPSTQLGPAQQTQQTPPQVSSDPGVDTLIPLSLQGKDHPLLQQLLPNLLNPTVLGDLSALAGFHNMVGLGAGALLLPPVQASALGMPLLHGPDGAINLLNNLQLNITPPSEGDKPIVLQETRSPAPQEDIPVRLTPQQVAPSPVPSPALEPTPPPQRRSEGGSVGGGGVIDPYTSFMDTIYTSFLQVSAKEQEEGAQSAPTYPTSPFCALPPVSFPVERPAPSATLPQASAPVSLSPQRACSLRNPDLSRLSLEAAARSPAQGTPKPSEDGASSPVQRKPLMAEGPTPPEPPLLPIYLEEAKTDCAGPYGEGGAERRGALPQTGGFRSPRDGGNGGPQEENTGAPLHTEQGRDQGGPTVGARRGRKRKQTLQNVLEDFRDMDATALEDTKPTEVLLKPERSVRGRRRRGARSQRQ